MADEEGSAMSRTLFLKIFRNDELVAEKTLTRDVIKIGKLKSSDLCLEDDGVARMHAVIEVAGSDVRVIDLGSSTGTRLNEQRVDRNALLKDGDRLAFGVHRIEVSFMKGFRVPVERPPSEYAVNSRITQIGEVATVADQIAHRMIATRPAPAIDPGQVEHQDGSAVTEVMAMYGETVLDVHHVGQIKNRRRSAPLFMAGGGVLFFAGLGLFATDVAQDWASYKEQVKESSAAARPAPDLPGHGLGEWGVGLAFLGLVPFLLGVVRFADKGVENYSIGEGHRATFTIPGQGLPNPAAFTLVKGGPGASTLNFTKEMEGDVTLGGQKISLAELVSSGRAASFGATYSFPLPAGAHCEVKHGFLKFHVNSVPRGRVLARKSEADKPFWLFCTGSLIGLGSLLVLVHLALPPGDGMRLDDELADNRFVEFMNQPQQEPEEKEPSLDPEDSAEEAGGEGQRHRGDEGKMGKKGSRSKSGRYTMKGPPDALPQMARSYDPDMVARNAGILGMIHQDSGHLLASPFGGAFAVGNADEDVWGGFTGTEVGEADGFGGLGLIGTGRAGGGIAEGTIGLGSMGLIGQRGGTGSRYGRDSGPEFGPRKKRVPRPRALTATVRGALDKDIIRRIVRNHINEVRHCYNAGLARDPNLSGRVAVQFNIGLTGRVAASAVSQSTVKNASVGSCIAKAVRRWSFPRPPGGGNVIVTYPFQLDPG